MLRTIEKDGRKTMYEVVEVFEAGNAQDLIKSGAKESPFVDENGQLFRSPTIPDEDE